MSAESDPNSKTFFYLFLEDNGRPKLNSDQIFTAPKNSVLCLEMFNGSLITRQIQLISNAAKYFPFGKIDSIIASSSEFDRNDFSDYVQPPIEISNSLVYQIPLNRSGPVQFLFIYKDPTGVDKLTTPFYIIVQPDLQLRGKTIPANSINLQTILSKSLGKINDFPKYYDEAKRWKYNFVHFTPIQKLGWSESLYCLRDNTQINDCFFTDTSLSNDVKLQQFQDSIEECRSKYGVGSIVDIVWNHAADNSDWWGEHPECGYNWINTPWWNCAYDLDKTWVEFSDKFAQCKTKFNFQPYVRNEGELNEIAGELYKWIEQRKLFEYFMINVGEMKTKLSEFYEEYIKDKSKYPSKVRINNDNHLCDYLWKECLDRFGESRNGVIINIEKYCSAGFAYNSNKNDFISKTEKFMNQSNGNWVNQCKSMLDLAVNNIKGGIRYEFIQMKNKAVIREKPLISNYFAVFDPNDKNKIFACNGWIMETDDPSEPTPNFTKKNSYYYFKRKVMIWSDCPKWNYGSSPEECPYLIEHMTKYVQDMAKIFNGFRLDNAHSTPIYLAEYLSMKAREVNPDLLIIAELFTTKENEIRFVNRIGINWLIREWIWCHDANGISSQIHRFGGGTEEMLGKLDEQTERFYKQSTGEIKLQKMKYLLPKLPNSIIFDLTHDNETYHQKWNNLSINLTNMACCSFAATAIGSTRGYDQLFPIQPTVVNETRQYEYDEGFKNIAIEDNSPEVSVDKDEPKEDEAKDEKVVFEFKTNAGRVDLAISSNNWKPDINLNKTSDGVFRTEITLEKGVRYYYKYVINSKDWVHDGSKPNIKDNSGNINNYIDVGVIAEQPQSSNSNNNQSYHWHDLKIFRRELNLIRNDLSRFKNEFYLHHDGHYVSIFRTFVNTDSFIKANIPYDGYIMICRTGFDGWNNHPTRVELPGIFCDFVCGCSMQCGSVDIPAFKKRNILSGTKSEVYLTKNANYMNTFAKISTVNNKTIVDITENMKSNTVIVLKYKLPREIRGALSSINTQLNHLYENWEQLTNKLTMCDWNLMLYKCEAEENDNTGGKRGNYGFKNWGVLVYAGISHLHKMWNQFKLTKENHPILDNIREGDWLLKYTIDRYSDQGNIKDISGIWYKIFGEYTKLYNHYKPLCFTRIIDAVFSIVMMRILKVTKNEKLINFSSFSRQLLGSVYEFWGYVESSRFKFSINQEYKNLTMCAGLPHFSKEYMRCWGRDTFIAFKGWLLVPGYFGEAKEILLNFASTLRHGLIPNLLDTGNNPRYNARDATWFFMQSIVDYINMSNDETILNEDINMIFVSDDFNEHNTKKSRGETLKMSVSDIVYSIFSKHANGINFREWRAGRQIDEQMKDDGFNIKIYWNMSNGFIYGGNKSNCGTWMDKMGSSEKAGNKGCPATPRNGADIEIIGWWYSSLVFFGNRSAQNKFKYSSVKLANGTELSFLAWGEWIKSNFEKCFFIESKTQFTNGNEGVYKDYLSDDNDLRHESQLRCNWFVAMAVAPELFDKEHAIRCIKAAEKHLIVKNCVGIRTLDDQDKNYNGNYINTDDSSNYHTAHGFNYHNGPEWVWPMGYYLISWIHFNECKSKGELFNMMCEKWIPFEKYYQKDAWNGLPEWTNKDGALCPGSCTTQAWSVGTILEAVERICHLATS